MLNEQLFHYNKNNYLVKFEFYIQNIISDAVAWMVTYKYV